MGGLTIKGAAKAARDLAVLADRFPRAVASAVRAELEIESTESQRRTPVMTGALRGSHVVDVAHEGRDVVGTITVGGPAAPYALPVHENLDAFHPVGQAKFLESTLAESAKHLPARMAARIAREMR